MALDGMCFLSQQTSETKVLGFNTNNKVTLMKRDDGLVWNVVSRTSACVSEIEFVYVSAHSLALCIERVCMCVRECVHSLEFLLQLKPD